MTTEAEERKRFEAWVSSPPFELSTARYPIDSDTWPGMYRHVDTEMAWSAWKEAKGIE
jgi:hypothetical protein